MQRERLITSTHYSTIVIPAKAGISTWLKAMLLGRESDAQDSKFCNVTIGFTMTFKFNNQQFTDLFKPEKLAEIDVAFLSFLNDENPSLYEDLIKYRQTNHFTPEQKSDIIIATAKALDIFITDFFDIAPDVERNQAIILNDRPIFAFKKWFILRRAKRRLARDEDLTDFDSLNLWLKQACQYTTSNDPEHQIATFATQLLDDKEKNEDAIEKMTQWCIQAIKTPEGRATTKNYISFKLPNRIDYQRLIPIFPVKNDKQHRQQVDKDEFKQRDGFNLTDERMTEREAQAEIDYCVYCHKNDGDFCSKGFPEKKGEPELGLRTNPLDNILTGCPLDEKISEMNVLQRDAFSIGALATIMIDNPMCPATGHRVCNDCMKACIYQKQDPVDVPQIETRILTDVLNFTWGVEIYDLFTRWNPLRPTQWVASPYNGLKVFIAGLGPAGFTLSHHLLMEGFAVVATDGLKIEPLPAHLIGEPIKTFDDIKESLDSRIMSGFGGVAEYGITVRWDKNFLKLIYISLMRRPYFQAFGGVRFGGTVLVEDLWTLGFDHAAIAVGAGLPRALPIPGSAARGMRQANDFLMALQLTGAAKKKSLANLQLRLPAVVIGGGLTGVDTATESQAYYITQVEKTLYRYETLCKQYSVNNIREHFSKESLSILDEFLDHAHQVKKERKKANDENREPDFLRLIRQWGGVSIVYRRRMQDSPAYVKNDFELHSALDEGIYYIEGLQPAEAILDKHGHTQTLVCDERQIDDDGNWHNTGKKIKLPARSILLATGAQPNIAYTFEHSKTFHRNGLEYQPYENINDKLVAAEHAEHLKSKNFGPFTSYDIDEHRVSFIGDTHPAFNGSVVGAIASAFRTYPKILALFGDLSRQIVDESEYENFANAMNKSFNTTVQAIERRTDNIIELTIHAPMAVKRFQPGQFFRVQNYETHATVTDDTLFQTEPLALAGFYPDIDKGTIKLMVIEKGASSKICSTLKANDPIAFMGPTGVRTKIPDDSETILILGNDQQSLAYVRAVAPELLGKNNKLIYIANFNQESDLYCLDEINACTDQFIYSFNKSAIDLLIECVENNLLLTSLDKVDRISVMGSSDLLRQFQAMRHGVMQKHFHPTVKVFGSTYSVMQCMLKGVCSQCLQWQINPETGQRTKAVFACSWQDQPIEIIDIDNLDERLGQNKTAETLTNLWLDYQLEKNNIEHL